MKQIGPYERSAVLLATSVHLGRTTHADFAGRLARWSGVSKGDLAAIRRGGLPRDPWLAQLIAVTWLLLDSRGDLTECDVFDLEDAGIVREDVYEVARIIRQRVAWPRAARAPGPRTGWHANATAAARHHPA